MWEAHDKELGDKSQFDRFVKDELDFDGKPMKTTRAIQAEL